MLSDWWYGLKRNNDPIFKDTIGSYLQSPDGKKVLLFSHNESDEKIFMKSVLSLTEKADNMYGIIYELPKWKRNKIDYSSMLLEKMKEGKIWIEYSDLHGINGVISRYIDDIVSGREIVTEDLMSEISYYITGLFYVLRVHIDNNIRTLSNEYREKMKILTSELIEKITDMQKRLETVSLNNLSEYLSESLLISQQCMNIHIILTLLNESMDFIVSIKSPHSGYISSFLINNFQYSIVDMV